MLDKFGLGGGDIAEFHRGQCAGHFVVFLEKLVVRQLQLIETLTVIFEFGLRQGQLGTDFVEVGVEAGNDLLFRRGIAFHSLDLRGRGGELLLQLLVGLDEVGRFFEGRLGLRSFLLRGIAGGDELGPLPLQFSDPRGKRLNLRLGGLGVLDRLIACRGQSLALGLEFRSAGLGFFRPCGHFLNLLGAFGDLAGQLFLLRVGCCQGSLQFLCGRA